MSQVKIQKLATGGTFIIDGQEISGDNAINAVRSYLGETTGGIMDALREGQTVNYNSANNTVNITNSNGQSLTDSYLPAGTKANVTDSRFRKDWGATFHTKPDQFKRELAQLRGVNVGRFNNTEKPVDLKALTRGSGWFYTKDKDGNNQYIAGPENNNRMEIIKSIRGYLEGDDDFRKGYKTDGWKQADIDALKNWVNNPTVSNDREGYWNGLFNRIQTDGGKNLTESDIQTLKLMGFDDNVLAENSSTGISPSDRSKWNTAGFGGLVDILGGRAHLNDDGSLSLNDGESWGWDLGDLYGQNIWFNDDFYNSTYGADGSFDPFRNLTLYNNRLYTLDNQVLSRILNSDGGFNSLKRSGNWSDADNIIRTRFTSSALDNPSLLGSENYSTFLSSNPNYRFSDLTGLFTIPGMENDNQIIQYVDLGEDSLVGPYRQYQYKYALLDPRGNKIKDLSAEDLVSIENGAPRETGLNTYKRISDPNNKNYHNRYYEDILDNNREATGFRFYRDINDPNGNVILHIPNLVRKGFFSNPSVNDKDIKLSPELAKVLSSNTKWLDNVIGDAQNKKNFQDILSWITNMGHGAMYVGLERDLKKLGFSDEEIAVFKNSRKGTKQDRRARYLVNSPTLNRRGGVLKYQTGGKAGGSKVATGVTEKQVSVKNTNPKNSYTIGSGIENWTKADSLEVGALLGDLGSLAAAFVPGANIASAATGAAASTARFAADRQRNTKGAGLNYLLNLGMDAATLLPIIGGGANSLKIIKNVKKALPTIIKAASVYGLGSAVVNSANKIANNEDWTLRDVSTVLNALTAGVGLSKQGGLGRSTKTTKAKGYSETIKVGDKEVNLDNTQINNILKSSNQPEALRNAIKQSLPENYKATDKEIATAAEKLLKSHKTFGQWIRRKDGDIVLNVKRKSNTSTEDLTPTENSLYNWWHGLGQNYRGYNQQLRGEKPFKITELTRTDTNVYNGNPATRRRVRTKGNVTKKDVTSSYSTLPNNKFTFSEQFTPGYRELGPGQVWDNGIAVYTARIGEGVPYQGIALPQLINPFTKANYQSNVDKQPSGAVYQPSYKNGGKIIKAQNGWLTSAIKNYNDPNFSSSFSPNKTILTSTTSIGNSNGTLTKEFNGLNFNTFDPNKFIYDSTYKPSSFEPTNKIDVNPITKSIDYTALLGKDFTNNIKSPKLNSITSSEQKRGGFWGNEWMLNKPNVDDAIRAAITARAIYHDRDLQRMALGKLYQRQFQTPQFDNAKYNYSDIEQGFNESAKPLLERKFVTSDAAYALSDKHQTAQQLSGLAGQKNALLTQRFNQTGDINRQINAQNETNRIQTANEKSQYLTNLNYQDAMLNSVIWNRLFSDVVNPFGQQMSQQGRDAWNKDLGMNYQFDAQNAQRVENARIQGDLNREFMSNWNALSDAEKKQYGDLETYVLTTNPERYKEIINGNPMYRSTMENIMRRYSRGIGAGMLYFKSGGNTVNIKNTSKNQRPAQEQIAINGHKAAKRSVDELSKALLSMLKQLQAMK